MSIAGPMRAGARIGMVLPKLMRSGTEEESPDLVMPEDESPEPRCVGPCKDIRGSSMT